jgi:soluble lytic murein transglycosylase-like protein
MALSPLVQQYLDRTAQSSSAVAFPGGRASNRAATALGERYNPNPPTVPKLTPAPATQTAHTPAAKGTVGGDLGLNNASGPDQLRNYVRQVAKQYGWDDSQVNAWYGLIDRESGWNPNAQNPTSTAYGIGQFLNSTWAGTGYQKTGDPQKQIEAMAKYIQNRYSDPASALNFWINVAPTQWGSHGY